MESPLRPSDRSSKRSSHPAIEQTAGAASRHPLSMRFAPEAETDSAGASFAALRGYRFTDTLLITNALKFASKVYDPENRPVQLSARRDLDLPFFPHAVEVGIKLMAKGAPRSIVVAGLLHDVFHAYVKGDETKLINTLASKFEHTMRQPRALVEYIKGVSPAIRPDAEQWHAAKRTITDDLLRQAPDDKRIPLHYPDSDVAYISKAMWFANNFFSGIRRKWGTEETLPMLRHAAETGLILMAHGHSKEVVAAGFLHDVYEGYVKGVERSRIENKVKKRFGDTVHNLISAVTEPRVDVSWLDRKMVVVKQLQKGDVDVNTLVCASKISTIAEGNKFAYVGGNLNDWSGGSPEENLRIFNILSDTFRAAGVDRRLCSRFDFEVHRWSDYVTP